MTTSLQPFVVLGCTAVLGSAVTPTPLRAAALNTALWAGINMLAHKALCPNKETTRLLIRAFSLVASSMITAAVLGMAVRTPEVVGLVFTQVIGRALYYAAHGTFVQLQGVSIVKPQAGLV